MAGLPLEETEDGEEEGIVEGEPLGYFAIVLVVEDAADAVVGVVEMVADFVFF